ncbi:MAG: hypothetical protein Crog4KO_03040 [Crocinitomicaceae bacterium]
MIINDSGYDITLTEFRKTVQGPSLALDSGDSSSVFMASYEQHFRLHGKFLGLTIISIDDPTGNLIPISNGFFPFRKSDVRRKPNVIRITSTLQGDSVIFNYTLNE